ncbi:hypothetical protein Taro_001762 [Colocasia esculenta]|uniref:Uncharacterized protein n=1 Tax=Colocasia esculenta TaxID=4460 RepID=A0A843TGV5_COLES|nr:hypothetical protein [Colocasia esculenta]
MISFGYDYHWAHGNSHFDQESGRGAGSDPADSDLSRVGSEDPPDSIGVWPIQDRPG